MGDLLNLRKQLGFYKAYHSDTVNVMIHSVFVPTIFTTSILMLNRIEIGGIKFGHVICVLYGAYYLALNAQVGALASGLIFAMNYFIGSKQSSLKTELTIWCMSWVAQFIGHGVFERRKPALFDNLVQSLVLAPYFILFELLFLLGFCQDLKSQLNIDYQSKTKK